MSAYKVREGTQVSHKGHVYEGGSTIDVTAAVAAQWLAFGWVTEDKPAARRKADKAS